MARAARVGGIASHDDRVELPLARDPAGWRAAGSAPVEIAGDLVRIEAVGRMIDGPAVAEAGVAAIHGMATVHAGGRCLGVVRSSRAQQRRSAQHGRRAGEHPAASQGSHDQLGRM